VSVAADGVSSQNFRHCDQLQQVLIDSLAQISQDALNPAID